MVSRMAELLIHLVVFFKQREIEKRASVYIVRADNQGRVRHVLIYVFSSYRILHGK